LEEIFTGIADETGLALFPHVLDHVLVLLVGVKDVPVLADVLLAADVTHMLLVTVFSVAMFVLKYFHSVTDALTHVPGNAS